jgi:hypothetical protein
LTSIAVLELTFNLLISLAAHGTKVLDKGLLEVAALIRGILLLILDMLDESLTDQGHVVRYFLGRPLVAVTSIGVGSPTGRIAAPLGVCKVELRVALLDHIGDLY